MLITGCGRSGTLYTATVLKKAGLNIGIFDSEFNLNVKAQLKEKVRDLSEYVVSEGDTIRLTNRGLFVCDEIVAELITAF